jgi:outer membrane protein TolC
MSTSKMCIALLIAFVFTKVNAQDQGKNGFTLQQAIDYAVKNSPSFKNAELDQQNALYKKREIAGLGLPQVSGSIDLKDYINIPTSLLPGAIFGQPAGTYIPVKFGTKYNSTVGFSASQLIFSSDYIFGLKASDQFMSLSRISLDRTKSDIAANVSKAYYNVLVNRDRIKLLEANITRLKKAMDDTKAYYGQGFAEQIDAQRLEVQFNNLLTELEKVKRLIGLSETLLKFQMGYKLDSEITLMDSLNIDVDQIQELIPANNISQRPDYRLLQANQDMLDLNVKRLQYGYLPTLAAYGAYQYNAQRNTFNLLSFDKNDVTKQWFKVALVGVTLNVNVFDGLQRHNRIQQARIESQKNLNILQNLEQAGQLESTVAAISYNNAYYSLKIQKKNLELAQKVADVAQKKFQAGVGSNLEVVNAEASLKEAQTNYYNAMYDMLVAKIDYLKAQGTLIK